MEKLFISTSCAVLCSGFAFSIYQAANDYGMKENKLHSAIVAQSDETSGGGSGGGVAYYDKTINIIRNSIGENSGTTGSITINSLGETNSLTITGLRKNTKYYISYIDRYCMASQGDLCYHGDEIIAVIDIVAGGSETTGGGN